MIQRDQQEAHDTSVSFTSRSEEDSSTDGRKPEHHYIEPLRKSRTGRRQKTPVAWRSGRRNSKTTKRLSNMVCCRRLGTSALLTGYSPRTCAATHHARVFSRPAGDTNEFVHGHHDRHALRIPLGVLRALGLRDGHVVRLASKQARQRQDSRMRPEATAAPDWSTRRGPAPPRRGLRLCCVFVASPH